jgi:hypothetical protein
MKIARLLLVMLAMFVLALPSLAAPVTRDEGKNPREGKDPRVIKGGGLFTPAKSHDGRTKAAGEYWFYCYSDPGTIYDCDGTSGGCHMACEIQCGGNCDWCDSEIEM